MFVQFCGWWYKIALSFSLPGNDSFLTKLKSNKRNYLRAELKEKYLNWKLTQYHYTTGTKLYEKKKGDMKDVEKLKRTMKRTKLIKAKNVSELLV